MDYTDYSYLWPPRPEKPVPHGLITFYENRGWWAQVKKNGTCTVIFTNGKDVIFKTRHGADADHRLWSPLPEHLQFFRQQKTNKWNVYTAELLHSKTPNIKNELYIFDKIVDEGIQLVDSTFEDRQLILQSEWAGNQEADCTRVDKYVTVAANFSGSRNISKIYNDIVARSDNPQDEGVVLKNPGGRLKPCFKQNANDGWMVKVRRPHKNYSF